MADNRTPLAKLIDKTRKAVGYHQFGYGPDSGVAFNADIFIQKMEELTAALDEYDNAPKVGEPGVMVDNLQARGMYAIMRDGKLVMVAVRDPDAPRALVDITEELARLLHHARSCPATPEPAGEPQ